MVRRDVVRLVTPGTITEDALLDARRNNFLSSLFPGAGRGKAAQPGYVLASLDISTGEFLICDLDAHDLPGELIRLAPSEVVLAETHARDTSLSHLIEQAGAALTPVPGHSFESGAGRKALKTALGVSTLDGFGTFSRAELAAIGGLLGYVEMTQLGKRPLIRAPRRLGPQSVMVIDAATRSSLELTRSLKGDSQTSLLAAVDRTVTGPGSRELAARLSSPLIDPDAIAGRLDAVSYFLQDPDLRAQLRRGLKACPDMARALSRVSLGRGGPRDLGALRQGLQGAMALGAALEEMADVMGTPVEVDALAKRIHSAEGDLVETLTHALAEELPIHKRDGGFVRSGFRADLDENRTLRDKSQKVLAALQVEYAEATGIKSLKVRHNNVLGYFVEVTPVNADIISAPPHQERFIHRQTLASAVRFTTTELGEIEAKILAAGERAMAIEQEVFTELCDLVLGEERVLADIAAALAELDHYCGLAELAEVQNYVRPEVDGSTHFEVQGGRHPVVEQALDSAKDGPLH